MIKICSLNLLLFVTIGICKYSVYARKHEKLKEVFSWKQIGYKINGYSYRNSSDYEYKPHAVYFEEDLEERERFFIQPNNVPIGFEVYNEKIFVTVPRRRYGIPSTLNYVTRGEKSPYLKPYPDMMRSRHLFSVYRPRVDVCDRLWMVDTGHLEVPRHVINWRDGLFSVALARRLGNTLAYYHPLVSTQEFAISTNKLKTGGPLDELNPALGDAGPNTQRGSHDIHSPTNIMFFANVAQAAVMCWNINTAYNGNNLQIVAQDTNRLGYISDLKVRGDDVWLLANQIPKFVYNTQNINEYNYFIMRGSVQELIAGTKCLQPN
ncbi:hypothetical protein evm_000253 [Chilo suppressalis]|nr:hypothetical protein evm_000253 [Chilo suppressalis]